MEDRVPSSSTQTFEALRSWQVGSPPKKSRSIDGVFKNKLAFIGSVLMFHWVPKNEHARDNMMPQYVWDPEKNKCDNNREFSTHDLMPFHEYDAASMHHYFTKGHTNNLGSLVLLNALMATHFSAEHLMIACDKKNKTPLFIQKVGSCWLDFIHPEDPRYQFKSSSWTFYLQRFTKDKTHHQWWQEALDKDITKDAMFQLEINSTFLRIFLTGDHSVRELIENVLQEHPQKDAFNNYVLNKINSIRCHLNQDSAWLNFVNTAGEHCFRDFWYDLKNQVMQEDALPLRTLLCDAMKMNISGLERYLQPSFIEKSSMDEHKIYFNYCLMHIKKNWQELSVQTTHLLWKQFESTLIAVSNVHEWFTHEQMQLFFLAILNNAIQKGCYSLVSVLLNCLPELLTMSMKAMVDFTFDESWIGHSPLYIAMYCTTATQMAGCLRSRGAQLLNHELARAHHDFPAPIPRRMGSGFFVDGEFFIKKPVSPSPDSVADNSMIRSI